MFIRANVFQVNLLIFILLLLGDKMLEENVIKV